MENERKNLTETLQEFEVITIEVDEDYCKIDEDGSLITDKRNTLLYKEFKIDGKASVVDEAENFFKELCKKYDVTPQNRDYFAIKPYEERKELAKEGKPSYSVGMFMIKYNGSQALGFDRNRLKDAYKKEETNESKEINENFYDDAEEICDRILDTYYLCVDYVNQHKDNSFPENKKGFLNNYLNKIRDVIFNGKNESVNESKELKEDSGREEIAKKAMAKKLSK